MEYCRAISASISRSIRYKTGKIPIGYMTRLCLNLYYNFERPVELPSGDTFSFRTCIYYPTYGDRSTTEEANQVCVPIRVIGYKAL